MVLVSYKNGFCETVEKNYFVDVIMHVWKKEVFTYKYC